MSENRAKKWYTYVHILASAFGSVSQQDGDAEREREKKKDIIDNDDKPLEFLGHPIFRQTTASLLDDIGGV